MHAAAMPCGVADRRPRGGWPGSSWEAEATIRVRAVLHAAVSAGLPNLVLGAFGCGAYGNPVRNRLLPWPILLPPVPCPPLCLVRPPVLPPILQQLSIACALP